MEREELAAWLRLTLTSGVGNESGRKLLAAFGLPGAVFEQPTAAPGRPKQGGPPRGAAQSTS